MLVMAPTEKIGRALFKSLPVLECFMDRNHGIKQFEEHYQLVFLSDGTEGCRGLNSSDIYQEIDHPTTYAAWGANGGRNNLGTQHRLLSMSLFDWEEDETWKCSIFLRQTVMFCSNL